MEKDKSIRLIVTGGSGFIGTNLIDHYLNNSNEVLNLDLVSPRNIAHYDVWKQVDILDYELLKSAFINFNPTHVIHLAARTDLNENRSIEGYSVNIQGQRNVLKVLDECRNLRRAIFTSSMLVCKTGYNPKDYNDYNPSNLYGESKVIGEKIIKDWTTKYEWLIIRPTSIWGPWFGSPYKDFFYRLKNRSYFKLSGKSSTKTFGFIGNSVYQIDRLLFLDKSLINKRTFYIGDSPALNINKWADLIADKLNVKLISIPILFLRAGGLVGDILSGIGVRFPVTSFRVKNMTTDNVIELLIDTHDIIPDQPFTLNEGIEMTLKWMEHEGELPH